MSIIPSQIAVPHQISLTLVLLLLALPCPSGLAQSTNQQAAEIPPNILLIIVDDLGFADLGCLGSTDMRTPYIDNLFSDSLQLRRFYANCPVCSPTRATVLTGCYPDRVGVPGVIRTHDVNSWGYFSPITKTLPEQLRDLGYHTSAIGKWHLGLRPENHPQSRGFDSFKGFLGDMMDDYYLHRRHDINYMREGRNEIDPKGHATDLFSEWAVDFIRSQNSTAEQGRAPWFMYLAYNAPHTPIQPPDDWLKKVKDRESEIDDKRAKLVALIEHMDAGIGQVLTALRDSGQYDKTVVVFTSDNGGQISAAANNGPLRDGKQSMYEGGLRIPGCIRVPPPTANHQTRPHQTRPLQTRPLQTRPLQTRPGSFTDAVCCTADFLPTLVEIAGGHAPSGIDGISLGPLLANPDANWPSREIYFVRREGGLRYSGLTIEAVLKGNYKLVHNLPTQKFELFNIEKDPGEKTDLAEKEPKVFREMIAQLQRHIQRGGQVPWQKESRQ